MLLMTSLVWVNSIRILRRGMASTPNMVVCIIGFLSQCSELLYILLNIQKCGGVKQTKQCDRD